MKTTLRKGSSGNTANSNTEPDANGQFWRITTSKGRRGIECEATQVTDTGGGCFTYSPFDCKRLNLATGEGMATEKKILAVHAAGLIKFAELVKDEAPAYVLGVGQVIRYKSGDGERVIYKVERPGEFCAVYLDGSRFSNYERLLKEGENYTRGEVLPAEEVEALVKQATENEAREAAEEATAREVADKDKAEKIRIGAEIVKAIPAGARAVIVAELHENTSDMQSDYFAHVTKQVVYLAYSRHDKDRFDEMRAAAARFEDTQHLGPGKGSYTVRQVNEEHRYTGAESEHYTTEAEAQAAVTEHNADPAQREGCTWIIQPEEIEHREKYSMGAGYYLKDGYSDHSGWAVSKQSLPSVEVLQIAAAEGRYLCEAPGTSPEPDGAPEVPAGAVQIVESPRRPGNILVIGETYPIRAKLKSLGGFWNKWEKGWEFKGDRLQEVTAALGAQATQETSEAPGAEDKAQRAEEDQLQDAAQATGNAALLQAGIDSGRVMIVTPQVPATWSQHGQAPATAEEHQAAAAVIREQYEKVRDGAKIPPQSAEAKKIMEEIRPAVKGNSADQMEEAAAKVETIDAPEAVKFAATLRTMAGELRAKRQEIAEEVERFNDMADHSEEPGYYRPAPQKSTTAGQVQMSLF
jgi:hypothetical protein